MHFHTQELLPPCSQSDRHVPVFIQKLSLRKLSSIFKYIPLERHFLNVRLDGFENAFVTDVLSLTLDALEEFEENLIWEEDPQSRLRDAGELFEQDQFTINQYHSAFPERSLTTVRRDLSEAVKQGKVVVTKTRGLSRYRFI